MPSDFSHQSHTTWNCKYHVVFIPKYRKKLLFGQIRNALKEEFHRLAHQKESRIEEGFLMKDHVHMLLSIPPKYSVAQVVGFLKGKTALYVARRFGNIRKNFVGQHFWARGYFVSTVGRDETVIRRYIQNQEKNDKALGQRSLFDNSN